MSDNLGVENIFKRFRAARKKRPLLNRISEKLVAIADDENIADVASAEKVTDALQRLLADGKLSIPKDAVSAEDFKESFLGDAKKALDTVLKGSGQPHLAAVNILTAGAMKWINNSLDKCGGNDLGKPSSGPSLETNSAGKHVVVYYLEEKNGLPVLPAINGNPKLARSRLELAFESWEDFLKLSVVQTDDPTGANLIITGKTFGPEVSDAVLALTDIGPPNGVQLRMVFDLAETSLTKAQFEATAAHEFGHAMGIRHANVGGTGNLMSPMLSEISFPQEADLVAAVSKGWIRQPS